MTEPVWTFPGPILDMLADALWEMNDAPRHYVSRVQWKAQKVRLRTDSGWVTIRRLEGT